MGYIKKIESFVLLLFMVNILSQCSSAQKLQKITPFELGQIYYQHWIAGVQGGGSGTNVYIPIILNKNEIELDSVYFQNQVAKLERVDDSMFIGRFTTSINQKKDLIMSSNPHEEYGNQVPKLHKNIPFELKDNQCVISYQEKGKTKYFMVDSIEKKQIQAYPSRPQNKE